MTGDGGLIALSLDDCDELLRWYEDVVWVDENTQLLVMRLREWRARHSSEDIPG